MKKKKVFLIALLATLTAGICMLGLAGCDGLSESADSSVANGNSENSHIVSGETASSDVVGGESDAVISSMETVSSTEENSSGAEESSMEESSMEESSFEEESSREEVSSEESLSSEEISSEAESVEESAEDSSSEESSEEEIIIDGTNNLEYALSEDSAYYIVSGMNLTEATYVEIPAVYADLPVQRIEAKAFANCTALKNISIPDSVISIGKDAFVDTQYYKDESNWEENVLYIGKYLIKSAYRGQYTVKEGTLCIADQAFSLGVNSGIKEVTICDSVRYIGEEAFYHCKYLVTVNIGNGVTIIGKSAFKQCQKLVNLTIGNNVKSIGETAFMWCNALKEVAIPDSVTEIGMEAFTSCAHLNKVVMGNGVKNIADYAFRYCEELEYITIGDNVESIGKEAFRDTKYLLDTNNWDDGKVVYIGKYLIYAKSNYVVGYTIKDGTLCIASGAFQDWDCISSLVIPSSVRSIGENCFGYLNSGFKLTFKGTMTQWNTMQKGSSWGNEKIKEVICSDGTIEL